MHCRGTHWLAGAQAMCSCVQPASEAQFYHSGHIRTASRNCGWSKVMIHCPIHQRASDSLRNKAGFRNSSSPNKPLTIHRLYIFHLLINLHRGRSVLNFRIKLSEWLKKIHSCQKHIKNQYNAWVGPIDTYTAFRYRVNSNYLAVSQCYVIIRKVQGSEILNCLNFWAN